MSTNSPTTEVTLEVTPTDTPSVSPSATPDVTVPLTGFTFTSSNSNVVAVSDSGVITPKVGTGIANVTVTYTDANGNQTSTSTSVNVYTKLTSLDIINDAGTSYKGNTISIVSNESISNIQLNPKYNSGNNYSVSSSYQGVTWYSDNTLVATVENGLISPVANSEGTATITCESTVISGITASVTIITSKEAQSISGVNSEYTIYTNAEPSSITLSPVINY